MIKGTTTLNITIPVGTDFDEVISKIEKIEGVTGTSEVTSQLEIRSIEVDFETEEADGITELENDILDIDEVLQVDQADDDGASDETAVTQ
jgi:copper chaperone CopZ